MKKLITMILMLLVAFSLFAVNDTQLQISTVITPVTGLKISQGAVIPSASWESSGITELSSALTSVAVTDLFVNLRTNKKTSFTINIDAPHLASDGITYTIPYTVAAASTGHGTAGSTINSGTVDQALVTFAGDVGTGLRILSHGFTIDIDDDSYNNAVEGTYTATIVFDIVVGS